MGMLLITSGIPREKKITKLKYFEMIYEPILNMKTSEYFAEHITENLSVP